MGLFDGLDSTLFGEGGADKVKKATKTINDVDLPDIEKMKVNLEQLVSQGILSPEQAQAASVDRNAYNSIIQDPRLKNSQLAALGKVEDIANSGMTATDRAAMNDIQSQNSSAERGSREAILQNAQQRGVGGSGLEMLAQLQNSQNSATRAADAGFDVTKQAQQRALDAIGQQSSMATNMRGQDNSEQQAKAQAANSIAQFNAQNRQATNTNNTNTNNAAQSTNLSSAQNLADTNTNTRNTQQQYNKSLIQQDYNNRIGKATAVSGALGKEGAQEDAEKAANKKLVGAGVTALAMSDARTKKDVKPFDASGFLDSITGYKYKYKDSKHGVGQHASVMAQDLEKTEEGSKMIKETPEGKMIDAAKATGPMLAALASLHKEIKELKGKK